MAKKNFKKSNAAHRKIILKQPDSVIGRKKTIYHSLVIAEQHRMKRVLTSDEKSRLWFSADKYDYSNSPAQKFF